MHWNHGFLSNGWKTDKMESKTQGRKKSPIYSNASKSKGGNRQNRRKQWRVRVREALWRRMANLGKGRRDSRSYCLRPWEPGKEERPNRHCSRLRLKKEKEKQRGAEKRSGGKPSPKPPYAGRCLGEGSGFFILVEGKFWKGWMHMVHVGLLLGSVGWKKSQASPEHTRGRNRILLSL